MGTLDVTPNGVCRFDAEVITIDMADKSFNIGTSINKRGKQMSSSLLDPGTISFVNLIHINIKFKT